MMNLDIVRNLKRTVTNRDGFIELSTEYVKNFEYAFYLSYSGIKNKRMYTKQSSYCFDVLSRKGNYSATFFYRYNGNTLSFQVYFNIDDSGNIGKIRTVNYKNIIEKEGYKIDYYDLGSSTTFIVFNGAKSLKKTKPFALNYLIKKGFNVIACLQNNNQYQELSFEDVVNYVSPLVEDHEVYLYGSSLGGYCALYYAGAVNGTVIASAPRNSAHPLLIEYSENKSSFNRDQFKHHGFNNNRKTKKDIYIFFDSYVKIDVHFINELIKGNFDNLSLIDCKYAGHEVLYHLNKTKQLNNIIDSIVNKTKVIVGNIDSTYTYIGKAKYYISVGDYEKSRYFSEKALEDDSVSEATREKFKKVNRIAKRNLRNTI